MSSTSKKALISAASIGIVLTQSSSLLAEKQNTSAPEKVTKIAAPIDLDEEVLYSALSDDVLEKAVAGVYLAYTGGLQCAPHQPTTYGCFTTTTNSCNKGQSVKNPASSSSNKPPPKPVGSKQ
jgi:hypothetical protein